jgi:hypothetical protein
VEVNEPVLIARPDDGPIGPKHVALNTLLMVIIDVLYGNINTLYKIWNTSGQIKLSLQDKLKEAVTMIIKFIRKTLRHIK